MNTEFVDMDNYLNKIWINVENSCFIHKPKIKNSKIVEAEKAISKKDQKQEKAENKKTPEKKGNDKKDTSSKGNEKKDDGKKETPLYHTVKADQTIYAISREYNVPVNRLLKLNPTLKNGNVVTGQKIKLKEK